MTDVPSTLVPDHHGAEQMQCPTLEALLAPVSPEAPCGPHLEMDERFAAFGVAARGQPEVQYGTFIQRAVPPDWREVHRQASTLFAETKDLRIAAVWTRALTHLFGLEGATVGLQLIEAMLATWWNPLHPPLDPDDDNDPFQRWSTLLVLDASPGLVRDLRDVVTGATDPGPAARLTQAVTALADRISGLDQASAAWPGPVLSKLQHFCRQFTEIADAPRPGAPPSERPNVDAELEHRREAALEALLAWVDGAGFDMASVCRRFGRLGVGDFAALVTQVAPVWEKDPIRVAGDIPERAG